MKDSSRICGNSWYRVKPMSVIAMMFYQTFYFNIRNRHIFLVYDFSFDCKVGMRTCSVSGNCPFSIFESSSSERLSRTR